MLPQHQKDAGFSDLSDLLNMLNSVKVLIDEKLQEILYSVLEEYYIQKYLPCR